MTAPELSPAEQEIVARFEAAPTPPEVLRENLAAALCDSDHDALGTREWDRSERWQRDHYRRLADAALAVFRGQQDPAVQRVEALCEIADTASRSTGMVQTDAIRAAIGGDGR